MWDKKLKELAYWLLCLEKNVGSACMPWSRSQYKREATASLHCASSVPSDSFWRSPFLCSSLGTSCSGRNITKCNKNLVVYASSHAGLARDCWDDSLRSCDKQLSGNNRFHSLPRLFWWPKAEKSSIALSFTYTFWIQFCPAFTLIPPYTFQYNSWVF